MKRLYDNKMLSVILAITMVIVLTVACSSNSVKNEPTPTPTSEIPVDPLGKYETPVTITSVGATYPEWTWAKGDDMFNNIWLRTAKEELGVDIKFDWAVDNQQYKNKVATMLASNSMPDFFLTDASTFRKLVQADAVMDITDIYAKYASPDVKKQDASFPEGFQSSFVNGKQYGIAQLGWGKIALPQIMWIRSDWLKASGMSAPKTVEELQALATTFMKKNKASYGIAIDKDLVNYVNSTIGLANGHHAYPSIWIKDNNGQIVYGSVQPEMKQTLTTMQNWYKNGVISKEFSVKDQASVVEDIVAGKVGIMFGVQWMGFWPFTDAIKKDPNAVWEAFEIPSIDSKPVSLQGNWDVNGYYVINKNAKNPEAVVKMMNWWLDKSIKGLDVVEPLKLTTTWAFPATIAQPAKDYDYSKKTLEAFLKRDPSNLTEAERQGSYDLLVDWADNKNPDGFGRYAQMGPNGSYEVIRKYLDADQMIITELRGATPDGYSGTKATLDKLELDTYTKIIMGAPVDATFDAFVKSWNELGGSAATAEINEIYNKK